MVRFIPIDELRADPRDFDQDRSDPRDMQRMDERDMRDEMARERELEEMVRADDQRRMDDAARARFEAGLREFTVDDLREMVNNSNVRVTSGGRISSRRPSGRDVIRRSGQFSRANLLMGIPVAKKPRKKNKKHCKNLSQCLRQANAELRTKKGSLRKGKTQADVMRRAQRLLRKMK
jgi:hypothetical protein